MPHTILGLDIGDSAIAAVLLETGFRRRRILACARVPANAPDGIAGALQRLSARMNLRADGCVASLPADWAAFRRIPLPFKDSRRIRQALAFEMEPMLPFSIEEMLVDYGGTAGEGHVLAAAVSRSRVSEYLALLENAGIDPSVLDIRGVALVLRLMDLEDAPEQGVLLDTGPGKPVVILYSRRDILLIRPLAVEAPSFPRKDAPDPGPALQALCAEVQYTLQAFGGRERMPVRPEKVYVAGENLGSPAGLDHLSRLLGIPTETVRLREDAGIRIDRTAAEDWDPGAMTQALALALRRPKSAGGFNLRREEFARKSPLLGFGKEARAAAVFVILALSLLAVNLGLDFHLLKARYEALDHRISQVFRETFPEVTRIVDPVHQMKIRVKEPARSISPTGDEGLRDFRALDLLKAMSEEIPGSLDVSLSRLIMDRESLRISGETDTFNTVEAVKDRLAGSGYFRSAAISSANLDRAGGKILFEITLDVGAQR